MDMPFFKAREASR